MVKKARYGEIINTEAIEYPHELSMREQTIAEAEVKNISHHVQLISSKTLVNTISRATETKSEATEEIKQEMTPPYITLKEFPIDEDKEKNQRARANALMDADCLRVLKMFTKQKTIYIDDLNKCIGETKNWLKISRLIRADFLEALDSTVRITPDGLAAWQQFNDLKKRKRI